MKNPITILTTTLLLVVQVSFSQDADYSQQLINQVESIKQSSFLASTKQEMLHRTCITSYLLEAKKNWGKLTPSAKKYFNVLMARPALTNEQIYYSTYFDIHYTTTGADAVNTTDANTNGTPDYVENMADVFDYVYETDSVSHNYTMPPSDGGAGGDDYYDVYIGDIGTWVGSSGYLYGFVIGETNIGDNPNSTTITETSAMTSYMGMNNDYSWVGSGSAGAIDTAIMVTAAHEFFHSIQMGYTTDNTNFISEATAAWMEDVIYPNLDDNLQYLMSIFGTPDVALNLNSNDNDTVYGNHWYAGWIYFKYLQEKTNTNIVKKIYERCITVDEIQAIDDELIANWSSDFAESFENWLIANAIMTNNAAYNPYTYSRASVYDNYIISNGGMNVEGTNTYSGTSVNWYSDIDGNGRLHRLSADYLEIVPNQNFSLTLTPDNPLADLDVVLLKVNTISQTLVVQPSVASGNDYVITVNDQSNFDMFVAIIERGDEIVTDTLSEQYSLTISGVTGVPNLLSGIDKISIYPNPIKDKLILSGLSDKENFAFEIKDVLGRTVYLSANIVGREKFIAEVADIDNGVYFLTLTDSNNKSKIQKVVISK